MTCEAPHADCRNPATITARGKNWCHDHFTLNINGQLREHTKMEVYFRQQAQAQAEERAEIFRQFVRE